MPKLRSIERISLQVRLTLSVTALLFPTPSDAEQQKIEVRDSAKVQIVTNSEPILDPGAMWIVRPQPIVQIGQISGDHLSAQFAYPLAAIRLPMGGWAVVDNDSYEIRVFSEDGSPLLNIGRKGSGPGEFADDPVIAAAQSDTLVVFDQGTRRLSWWSIRDGTLLQETGVRTLAPRVIGGRGWQVRSDGLLLNVLGEPPRGGNSTGAISTNWRRPLLMSAATNEAVEFDPVPCGQTINWQIGRGTYAIPNPFAHACSITFGADPYAVVVNASSAWEVRQFDADGVLRRIVRASIQRLRVTTEVIRSKRGEVIHLADAMHIPVATVENGFERIPIPDSLPAIEQIRVTPAGYLWVKPTSADSQAHVYDIIDPQGRWLGTVRLPADAGSLIYVDDEYVITVWRDEREVSFIRVYRIDKHAELK